MKKKLLLGILLISALMFSANSNRVIGATPGTSGELEVAFSLYNPGAGDMIKMKELEDNSYYGLEVGTNLASSVSYWYNFTASADQEYHTFNIGSVGSEQKIQFNLYGFSNDSDQVLTGTFGLAGSNNYTGVLLDTLDLQVLQADVVLSTAWFLGIAFTIVIFFIFVGIVATLVVQRSKNT